MITKKKNMKASPVPLNKKKIRAHMGWKLMKKGNIKKTHLKLHHEYTASKTENKNKFKKFSFHS